MDCATYLRLRREASGLLRVDVAAELGWKGGPAWLVTHFEQRIAAIEAGQELPSETALLALRSIFAFDIDVAKRLLAADRPGPPVLRPRVCTGCGCSSCDPCEDARGVSCSWAETELCSTCAEERALLPRLVAGPARHLAALRRLTSRATSNGSAVGRTQTASISAAVGQTKDAA